MKWVRVALEIVTMLGIAAALLNSGAELDPATGGPIEWSAVTTGG